MERYKLPTAVYLLFLQDGKILMQRRANTGYKDGEFGLPSGHKEANESLLDAATREAKEELGITIKQSHLKLLHTSNRRSDDREYLDFYFLVDSWEGEICNAEPDKCSELAWFPLETLPDDVIDYLTEVLGHIDQKNIFSQIGW